MQQDIEMIFPEWKNAKIDRISLRISDFIHIFLLIIYFKTKSN